MIDAQFVITIHNMSLEGAEILTLTGKTENDCRLECMLNDRCKSFNFCNGTNTCQLNCKIAGDAETNLVNQEGCVYKSTNNSAMKVSN